MYDGAETQGIVEAFAEHDSCDLRLSGVVRAAGCEDIVFCAYCNTLKGQKILTQQKDCSFLSTLKERHVEKG